jgi:hypothetical protein
MSLFYARSTERAGILKEKSGEKKERKKEKKRGKRKERKRTRVSVEVVGKP